MAVAKILSAFEGIDMAKAGLVLGIALPVAFCVWEFRSWYRLKDIPGPLFNAFSIYPMLKNAATGQSSMNLKKLQEKYGILLRVGPNEVLTGDPDFYRKICGVRTPWIKGPFYEAAANLPDQHSLFSMADEKGHRELKAKLAPGYAGRDGNFEESINKITTQLVHLIDTKYISTPTSFRPIEFAHKAQYYALDAITQIGLGQAVGYLENDKDLYDYVAMNDAFFPILLILLNIPWFTAAMRLWPMNAMLPRENDVAGFGRLWGFAKEFVDKRFAPDAKPQNDMMGTHIRNGLTYKETLAEVLSQFVAGSDSTATAIRMAIFFLISNPAAMQALRREIDAGVVNGAISAPIRDAEAQKLPYLRAVIWETLRFHPPAVSQFYKEVPAGGATVEGHYLPGGTQLGINLQYVLRRSDTFGPDAEVFRPDRWIEAQAEAGGEDGGRYRDMLNVAEVVFGYGKFMCPGKTIAFMELTKVIVELLRRYDFALVDPVKPMNLRDAGFWVTKDFWLRVTKREAVV